MSDPSSAVPASRIEERIEALDVSLFDRIDSQTTREDRQSLLALQAAIRDRHPQYVYLEIGSHLGGSIQPHLMDPRCRKIYSIDKRPTEAPDPRFTVVRYPDNSSNRMRSLLTPLAPDQMHKIETFDMDAREVDRESVRERPNLCFVDGEHTDRAVISDFDFCLSVVAPDGVIAFHDSGRVHRALQFLSSTCRTPHFTVKLRGSVFAIVLGERGVLEHPAMKRLAFPGWAFLALLRLRDAYQRGIPKGVRTAMKPLLRPVSTRLPQ